MKIQIFQHVSFEGPAMLEPYFAQQKHEVKVNRLHQEGRARLDTDSDALVVMGGPMGVNDVEQHEWMSSELSAIGSAIDKGIPVLGICLGAQMIAKVLGAEVKPMGYREIGWHRVTTSLAFGQTRFGSTLPPQFAPLHWHGDQFAIPEGAVGLGESEACATQGFVYADRVLALQFHLEFDQSSVQRIAAASSDELDDSAYVQSLDQMLAKDESFEAAGRLLDGLLQEWLDVD